MSDTDSQELDAFVENLKKNMENQQGAERKALMDDIIERAIPQIMDSPFSDEIKSARIDQLRKELNK